MGQNKSKYDLTKHKDSSISELDRYLCELIDSGDPVKMKKADLISYWIKDYTGYLEFEEEFNPKRLISYKRGDIIKVGLGFNLGSEQGGRHYAVVLDNKNAQGSSIITIAPLSSVKANKRISKYDVELGRELFEMLNIKCKTMMKFFKKEVEECSYMMDEIKKNLNELTQAAEARALEIHKRKGCVTSEDLIEDEQLDTLRQDLNSQLEELQRKNEIANEEANRIVKVENEIKRMKAGSVALLGQITTISKMRIYDPLNNMDVLSGIRLPEETMDKINEKMKELYIH